MKGIQGRLNHSKLATMIYTNSHITKLKTDSVSIVESFVIHL